MHLQCTFRRSGGFGFGQYVLFPRKVTRDDANIFPRNIVKLPKRRCPMAYTSYKERKKNRKRYKIKS